jgi:hypothetical protein
MRVTLCLIISLIFAVCKGADFYPNGLVTQSGSVSSTPLSSLTVKDQSGTLDTFTKYVEFYGSSSRYQGVFSFPVTTSSASSFSLNVNFRGPSKSGQEWKFEWYVPSTNSYVFAGDNSAAGDWAWSSLSFSGSVSFSSLVSSNTVQVRFSSTTSGDDCDLDFLQLSVTSSSSTSSSSTTSSPSTPSPTTKPTTKPTPSPTTKPTTKPTSPPSSSSGKKCPAGTHYRPGPYTTWQWQLSGTVDTSFDVQLYDIDMFGASASLISSLHAQGRAVVCYIDTAYEPGRPDSAQFTSAVLGNGIDGWPGQKWVDIRSQVVRNIMASRIALAASKQCDAVEMDDVDAYLNDPGFPLTYNDQISFNTFLATTAHSNSLGIALKNDLDQITDLVSSFDFAVNEQCYQYSECADLSKFINQGKAVLGVEYELATSKFCTQANAAQFSWLKKNLDLDAPRTPCCTSNCGGTFSCVAN